MRKNFKQTKAYKLGNSGENKVKLVLDKLNDPEYNIKNVMLEDKNGETHQIDLICIHDSGVFVTEVKNVCGYKVKCEDDWKYWTYDWIKDKKLITCKLYNPIWQNRTHCDEIRKILDGQLPIYSMIVFANNNTLVHERPFSEPVLSLTQVKDHLSKFPKRLTSQQKEWAKKQINKYNRKDISLSEHISNIEKRFY